METEEATTSDGEARDASVETSQGRGKGVRKYQGRGIKRLLEIARILPQC